MHWRVWVLLPEAAKCAVNAVHGGTAVHTQHSQVQWDVSVREIRSGIDTVCVRHRV